MTIEWKGWFAKMSRVNPKLSDPVEEKQITFFWEHLFEAFKARLLAEITIDDISTDLRRRKPWDGKGRCPSCNQDDQHHPLCSLIPTSPKKETENGTA